MFRPLHVAVTTAALVFATGPVAASVILAVSDNDDFGIPLNTTGATGSAEAAGTFFTLTERYTDVTISAPLICVSCNGSVVLHLGPLGPSATVGDLVDGRSFTTSLSTLFTDLDLGPGIYTLLAGVRSGTGGWSGSISPTLTSDGLSTHGFDIRTSSAAFYLPQSTFVPTFANGSLAYSITGTRVGNAPLPATALLLIGGLPALGLLRRRRALPSRQTCVSRPDAPPPAG